MNLFQAFNLIPQFRNLSPASHSTLLETASLKELRRGDYLFRDKEESGMIYYAVTGIFSLYKLGGTGEKRVIFILEGGQLLSDINMDNGISVLNCQAMEKALAIGFRRDIFLKVMEEEYQLTREILNDQAIRLRRLYRQLTNTVGTIRGDKRLAAKLWKLANDHGTSSPEGIRIDLHLSMTSLSEMSGFRRETVSRYMKVLAEENLITYGNGRIFILDMKNLADYFRKS